jgi:hypothetical protein
MFHRMHMHWMVGPYGLMIGSQGTLLGTFILKKNNLQESIVSKHADTCILTHLHCATQRYRTRTCHRVSVLSALRLLQSLQLGDPNTLFGLLSTCIA